MKIMKIKDIVNITGGNTKVIIYGIWDEKYHTMHQSRVDDMSMRHIPYGEQEVSHLTVINGEDNLVLQFDYPHLTVNEKESIEKLAIGYPYPTDWIEMLYVKYGDIDFITKILMTFDKDGIYSEIKVIQTEVQSNIGKE